MQESAEYPDDLEPLQEPERPPFWVQLWELTKRSWITYVRNPISLKARVMQYVIQALLIGFVYFHLSYTPTGARDREGALFFVVVSQIMSSLNSVLLTFPLERILLVREQSNGMYSVTSYFLGKFISTLPFEFFFPTFLTLVIYWMVQFTATPGIRVFMFWLTLVALNFASASLGLMLGCLFPNAEVAVTLAPVIIIPFMLFGEALHCFSFPLASSNLKACFSGLLHQYQLHSRLAPVAAVLFTLQVGLPVFGLQ